jgi:hypothetical protein
LRHNPMSYDNPRWGRRISPSDTYARELIYEVHDFLLTLSANGKSWLALYIQRRKLEEQFKIERLLSHSDSRRDFYTMSGFHKN